MSSAASINLNGGISAYSPLLPQLLEFNLLPSRTLHPAQISLSDPPLGIEDAQPEVADIMHRRWSQRMLDRAGAAGSPVLSLNEPALPLAMAAPGLLVRLARDLGIALLGVSIRRVIERAEVLSVRSELGDEGMQWALVGSAKLHPGMSATQQWMDAGWANAADLLGAGFLAQAWHDAPTPLRLRADWKMAPASLSAEHRTASGLDASQARALCLSRLKQMEPAWLSNFPLTH